MGVTSDTTKEVTYGSTYGTLSTPTKEGYTFSGWSEAPETMPAYDVEITGSFSVNTYAVTYMVDGEVYATDSLEYSSEIVLIDEPKNEGYTFSGWIESMTTGIMGMSELILISMMAGGIFALITQQGLMDRIVQAISSKVRTRKGAELSICALVGLVNALTANNTVAILSVGDIAKNISKRFDIDPRRSASLLDTTSCAVQGLLPYGAQLLMASSLAGITAMSIIPYLYYPMLIGGMVLLTIVIGGKKG